MPQGFGKANFGLGVFAFDTGHYLASLLGGEDIHVVAFGGRGAMDKVIALFCGVGLRECEKVLRVIKLKHSMKHNKFV